MRNAFVCAGFAADRSSVMTELHILKSQQITACITSVWTELFCDIAAALPIQFHVVAAVGSVIQNRFAVVLLDVLECEGTALVSTCCCSAEGRQFVSSQGDARGSIPQAGGLAPHRPQCTGHALATCSVTHSPDLSAAAQFIRKPLVMFEICSGCTWSQADVFAAAAAAAAGSVLPAQQADRSALRERARACRSGCNTGCTDERSPQTNQHGTSAIVLII